MSGIFFSASLIIFCGPDLSVSFLVFKTNRLVSKLFTLASNLSYTVFLTTFFTTSLSLLKSTGTVFNLSTSILFTSVFKLAKFDFSAKLKYKFLLRFLNQFLLHN